MYTKPLKTVRAIRIVAFGHVGAEVFPAASAVDDSPYWASEVWTCWWRKSRALLLQCFYGARSERLLMEELDYNLLFRWFVGLGMDDRVWDATTTQPGVRHARV